MSRILSLLAFVFVAAFSAAQNVGIGTSTPTQRLEVAGSVTLDNALILVPATIAAGATIALPVNTHVFIADDAATAANVATYAATPADGQLLTLLNQDADAVDFAATTVAAGQSRTYIYDGTTWVPVNGSENPNTMDEAYDEGGAGVGRTITADAGAVQVLGTDGFEVTGTFGSGAAIALAGAGTRMFFNPAKSAFRAGTIDGTQWDDANVGNYSVALGQNNTASNTNAVVAGGLNNTASGQQAFVGNGQANVASVEQAVVVGGESNSATGIQSFVGSGINNTVSGFRAVLSGGQTNQATGNRSFIGGGQENFTSGNASTACGGLRNSATANFTVVAGGIDNAATGNDAAVLGGSRNTASGDRSMVAGGQDNTASGLESVIAGGQDDTAAGTQNFIGGGELNFTSGTASTIGGGLQNAASADYTVVAGGINNSATGNDAAVLGGSRNTASGARSMVGGGQDNTASGTESVIAGGQDNTAAGLRAAILGGIENQAPSFGEAVVGIYPETYTAANASGFNAADRIFTVGNGTGTAARSNALTILKNGNTGIGFSTPSQRLDVNGNVRANAFNVISDARLKENPVPIGQAMARLAQLTGYTYTWKADAPDGRQHPTGTDLGVLAQEVEAVFPAAVHTEAAGWKSVDYNRLTPVLLQALKELHAEVVALKQQNAVLASRPVSAGATDALRTELDALRTELDALKSLLGNAAGE